MFEMAIVLPILLMLLLGIIEMGRVMMINQMATNACREGCRRAIVPGATDAQITSIVNGYLDAAGISATGREVKLMNSAGDEVSLATINSHETVTIEVRAPYSANTWGFTAIMGGKALVSRSTMRRE
ncbi:MAG: TadE/TadG family type IV pilus assembly protein [Pirellulaceae bacterium]